MDQFTNNNADGRGAAVFADNIHEEIWELPNNQCYILLSDAESFDHLILQDVIVKDNHCSCNDYNEMRAGAIYFNRMTVDIFGNTNAGSLLSSNSPRGAIQGTNGVLQLHGNIKFINNSGVNRGGHKSVQCPTVLL